MVSLLDVADGVTDATDAIQAHADTGAIPFPPGIFRVSRRIELRRSGIVAGCGTDVSMIVASDPWMDVFSTTWRTVFRDLGIGTLVPKTGGAGIRCAGGQHLIRIANVHLDAQYIAIAITNGGYWVIEHCAINRSVALGIHAANTNNPDEGDTVITGNLIEGGPEGIGLLMESSGHRVTNNKFLGHRIAILVQPSSPSVPQVDIDIAGNSIENQSLGGVIFQTPMSGSGISNSRCAGNQLSGQGPNGGGIVGSGNIQGLIVEGNLVTCADTWGIQFWPNATHTPGQILLTGNLKTGTPLEGPA